MPAQNHTPLDDNTLRMLGVIAETMGLEPSTPQIPPTPVSVSPSPEGGPMRIDSPAAVEDSKPAETTAIDEAKEQGETPATPPPASYVDENPEHIELPEELKNLGLKAVKHDEFPDFRNVKLPISDEKVLIGEKAPINSSMRWLAEFAKFLLWRAHIVLKTIHGKVVRVVKK